MKAPITVVTSFGLARTPAQVGMIEVLHGARRSRPDSRSSVRHSARSTPRGLAAGCHPAHLREFWQWLLAEVMASPVRTSGQGPVRAAVAQAGGDWSGSVWRRCCPRGSTNWPSRCAWWPPDLETGDAVLLDSGDLVEAVMASCALPGLLPPVDVRRPAHLIDGGLVAGMPLWAVPDETRTVIVLDTGHAAMSVDAVAAYRWWEVAALSYAHQIREQAVNALLVAAAKTPVVMVSTDYGRMLDVADPLGCVQAGRDAAERQLAAVPNRLRRGVYNLPPGLAEYAPLAALTVNPGHRPP
jgi:hypothetical protein